jgi:hypothetical protein
VIRDIFATVVLLFVAYELVTLGVAIRNLTHVLSSKAGRQ